MADYAMIEISTGFLHNFIVWDGSISDWDTGSGYYLELRNDTASYLLPPNSPFAEPPPPPNPIIIDPNYTGSFTGSLTGSFNDYSGSLGWLDEFASSSRSGSFTGSFTGSINGSSSYALTASYLDILKAGTVRFNEWGLDGTINNYYTSSVTFSSSYSNNSYAISLTCGADVRTLSVTNKTVSGFEINSNSSTTMSDNVYWIAVPHNNP